jgi:hypothetical protein
MRTYIYIDGFNFYYGAVKDTPFKWLDFKALLTRILKPHHAILCLKYFTALVSATPQDPTKTIRQKTFIRALQAHIPEMEVYYGHFLSHEIWAPLANPLSNKRTAKIIKTEEKGSDVNLAVHLLNDACLDRYDCAVVISNDSDRLHPAEDLLHPFSQALTGGVARMAGGAAVNGGLPAAAVLSHVRHGLQSP